ncbi:DUF382-domain-containing protein [Tilletiaria anomala UBC 951]|uniref:DUF382-domain-containing protein n=1 Tax=Tilletiaria anomala (strain ATCC 24038 / CBS 436.72 / UBC 951) TaxID=1037660 RepID=A0A066VZN2_TILAU|nr:DUF382-domain-containing protein [Tilletiaria anomala UBC 951]KDN45748.1 DUF382-domain-containing protein [Tilletiaria anomala UBC 951]
MSAVASSSKNPLPNGNAGIHAATANGSLKNANGAKLGKAARRRAKKKEEKAAGAGHATATSSAAAAPSQKIGEADAQEGDSAVADTAEPDAPASILDAPEMDEEMRKHFGSILQRFAQASEDTPEEQGTEPSGKGQVIYSDEEDLSDEDDSDREHENANKPLSKKKQKKIQRLTVAELKQLVAKPDVVEGVDVTANDPRLLVHVKSYRNTVPVPAHWSLKRDYLGNKRGIEKPPFQLPSYIADTGIATIKDALREREADQTLKAQTRGRVQPKMGKVDIDYQKLHDAFFRFQTKPPMSNYGEIYYEGKEFETKFKERRPGDLSDELKEALSIPPLAPPPWLIAMQRYGPPPSYPHLKIPGLNTPIPPGAQFGFHQGGWGQPPVDAFGRPLYGDVFGDGSGLSNGLPNTDQFEQDVQKEIWGELEPEEDAEEEEEEEEEEEQDEQEDQTEEDSEDRGQAPFDGLVTPSGMESVNSTIPPGLETPAFIELRKDQRAAAGRAPGGPPPPPPGAALGGPKQLYQVIPESQTAIRGIMGSERGYDVYGAGVGTGASASGAAPILGQEDKGTKRKAHANGIDVALDPAELEGLTEAEIARRYDEAQARVHAARNGGTVNDTSREEMDMLREELARKRHQTEVRRQERRDGGGGGGGRDRQR